MKASGYLGLAVILFGIGGTFSVANAAEPPGGVTTVWNMLGIPQGIQGFRDATLNRGGRFPGLERKPPLKRIGDPANLAEDQPKVVQDAAKIKIEEDLAKQKIKAIKYLAQIGCGCHKDVDAALLDALDDCTEEVRYEAAMAFCNAAGDPCDTCTGSGCCNAKTMTKLYDVAYGQDASGCYKERSTRVRAAAQTSLRACRRVVPVVPATVPELPGDVELPGDIEMPRTRPGDLPSEPSAVPNGVEPLRLKERGPREPTPAVPPAEDTSGIVNPITLTGLAQDDELRFSESRPASTTERPAATSVRPAAANVRSVQRGHDGPPSPGRPRNYVYRASGTSYGETGASKGGDYGRNPMWWENTSKFRIHR
ncbi:MAG: hypothetical protein HQ567_19005 [Candidatus Nealsonbacteria bacterium]|nr:hypothetical protein [Candidatus Nealsonbacteria bacterium]